MAHWGSKGIIGIEKRSLGLIVANLKLPGLTSFLSENCRLIERLSCMGRLNEKNKKLITNRMVWFLGILKIIKCSNKVKFILKPVTK